MFGLEPAVVGAAEASKGLRSIMGIFPSDLGFR